MTNLRQKFEDQARQAGHPHPETLTPTELLDIIDNAKNQARDHQDTHDK